MDKESVTNNPRELGERLWAFKSDQKFCDAYLLVNDQRIPVHANVLASFSPFFENTFENEKEVTFTDVDMDVMLSLIEYCYKGTIDINANNALNLLQMASILGMPSFVENCINVLKNTLNTENCLSMWKSDNFGEHDALKKHIIPFIKENIGEIYLSDDFALLDYDEIKQIFTSKAKPKSEKTLYDALKRWLNHEVSRKNHSTELLGYINLGCIPKDSIDSSEAQTICGLDSECLLKLFDGLKLQGSVTDCSSAKNTLIVMGGDILEQSQVIEIFDLNLKQWVQINYEECNKTDYATALIDNKIIIIGGNSSVVLKTVEYYDLKTGQTESLPQSKYPRYWASAVSYGNEVFVFGGFNENVFYLSSVEKWSPKTRTWQEVAPLSIARDRMGAAVLDDEIFVVGGYNNINGYLSATEAYNPTSNTWRKCKDMNHRRYCLGVAAVNGYLFAVGGYDDVKLDIVERYDKSIDRWTMIQSLEVKKYALAAGNLNGQLVITGGYSDKYLTSVEAYDEKNNKWISLPSLNKERRYHCVMQIPWSLAELAIARKN